MRYGLYKAHYWTWTNSWEEFEKQVCGGGGGLIGGCACVCTVHMQQLVQQVCGGGGGGWIRVIVICMCAYVLIHT